jgi:hypothetical protein
MRSKHCAARPRRKSQGLLISQKRQKNRFGRMVEAADRTGTAFPCDFVKQQNAVENRVCLQWFGGRKRALWFASGALPYGALGARR